MVMPGLKPKSGICPQFVVKGLYSGVHRTSGAKPLVSFISARVDIY